MNCVVNVLRNTTISCAERSKAMNTKEIIDGLEEINYSLPHSLIPDKAIELIESLQAQLAKEKRRADRAVEDLNTLRKKSRWTCFACKYDASYVREICAGCDYNNGNNWAWRGDAEEGD
jgi:hypothetical protein